MEQPPDITGHGHRATPNTIMIATDKSHPDSKFTRAFYENPAPSPVSNFSEAQEPRPGPQQHARKAEPSLPSHPEPPHDVSHWHRKYLQQEQELAAERAEKDQLQTAHRKAKNEVLFWEEKCSRNAKSLEEERQEHSKTRLSLQHKQQDARKWHLLLQDANDKMGAAMNHHQVRHQLEDAEITTRVTCLRLDIRSFCLDYGELDGHDPRISDSSFSLLQKYLKIPEHTLEAYIESPSARPSIIRAFIWAFLEKKVFHRFCWAPTDVGNAIHILHGPSEDDFSDADAEIERNRIIWRANTTNMLLESMPESPDREYDSQQEFVSQMAQRIAEMLEPIVYRKKRDLIERLSTLLVDSLALDQALSQQVAMWRWYFPSQIPCQFDKTIHASTHKRQKGQTYEVQLVLAPALMKRGMSSGDGFLVNELQVKMEVELDLPPPVGRSSRSRRDVFNSIFRSGKVAHPEHPPP
ncbi:hypothetical protein VN97_g7514 [Penicillium thymicola]|uniref:Uncharacterized protein n=1 Tax=Penicillium thymicola TaxID=293382 RepID=A0AAI9X702_PENTH|nr:hypothetical protein VN97_g7514 [Penicillium thymicola]